MKQNKNLEIIPMKYKKMGVPGLPLAEVCVTSLKQGIHCHRFFSSRNYFDSTFSTMKPSRNGM